jgi:hypothetical protein
MSYPNIDAVNGGYDNNAGKSFTVTLPADIITGDLLIVFLGTSTAPGTITFPAGWTQLYYGQKTGYFTGSCYYKVATDEGASITVTTVSNTRMSWTSYRISGYSGTPEAGTQVFSSDETAYPDPPNLTPSWGAKDTLWFAVSQSYGGYTVNAYPTNYTDGRVDFPNFSANCTIGTAVRELNAASENPGTFTLSHTVPWSANTVAVNGIIPTTDTTDAATDVAEFSTTLNGTVTDDGGETVDYWGFVWDIVSRASPGNTDPTASAYAHSYKSDIGDYGENPQSHSATSLDDNTKYYFRFCAHNSGGWSYGDELDFTTAVDVFDKWVEQPDAERVLTLDNETAFTPDADYEPATKKYVDDHAGGGGVSEGTVIALVLGLGG